MSPQKCTISFSSQLQFQNGSTMCSAAAALMCYYMLKRAKNLCDINTDILNFIMHHSAQLFGKCLKGHGRLFDTMDTLKRIQMHEHCPALQTDEVFGLVGVTPSDMCNAACMDLSGLLQRVAHGQCCAVTLLAHTVAIGKLDKHWWYFDSLGGDFVITKSEQQVEALLTAGCDEGEQYSAVIMHITEANK